MLPSPQEESMPAGLVDKSSAREVRLWEKAKAQAAKQGQAGKYSLIVEIFKRMRDRTGGGDLAKASEIGAHELFAAIKRGGLKSSTEQRKGIDVSGKNLSAPDRYALAGVVVARTPATANPNLRITGMAKATSTAKPKATFPVVLRPPKEQRQTLRPKNPRRIPREAQMAKAVAKACVIRKAGDGGKHSKCPGCKVAKACKADMVKQSMAEYATKARVTQTPTPPRPPGIPLSEVRAGKPAPTPEVPRTRATTSTAALYGKPRTAMMSKSMLYDGESVDDFQNKMNDSLTAKFGVRSYAREVYSDRVIVDVFPAKMTIVKGTAKRRRYYSVGYTREADGTFTFGKKVEVEQRTTYPPMSKSLLGSDLAKLGPVRIKAQTFADLFVRS